MKRTLREHFSIEINGRTIVGPAEVELTDAEAAKNEHKLEAISAGAPSGKGEKPTGKKPGRKPKLAKTANGESGDEGDEHDETDGDDEGSGEPE